MLLSKGYEKKQYKPIHRANALEGSTHLPRLF